MPQLALRPTHAPVRAYYKALDQFGKLRFDNEGNLRGAFEDLLKKCAGQFHWTLVPEYQLSRKGQHPLRLDAALIDEFHLPRGYWEAKDSKDDLALEIQKKFAAGYPRTNILFQTPARAILVQNGVIVNPRAEDQDITQPEVLVRLLRGLFEWQPPEIEAWERAVREFSERIPDLARGVIQLIERETTSNKIFQQRFAAFAELCRQSINPDLRDEAVEEMLVQHLLTERIFRRIFNNPEFTRRNVIAAEIEKVIDSLTSRHFSRDAFLAELDPFYAAIEKAADSTTTYPEKQHFLNHVYERFFQGFSRKQADTHGIVYTPQPIVDFMVRSVEEVLKQEFGRSLADQGVHILDPFTGTGNFITRIMQEIPATKLEKKYESELHCNEVMLLPYYIASMNIEHAYLDKIGHYKPFEGICLADTFDLRAQTSFFSEANVARIARQRSAPIFVVIGNPPYFAWQDIENDDNKSRVHESLNARIAKTYGKASRAVNKNGLRDPYIKAFRWASDRIGDEGLIALVTNSGFLDSLSADGMRFHLSREFDRIAILDLGGNVRRNPHLSGTKHNVFQIQVGVCITLLVKRKVAADKRDCKITYEALPINDTRSTKLQYLAECASITNLGQRVANTSASWPDTAEPSDFKSNIALKDDIFKIRSNGVKTNRDSWAYSFQASVLAKNIKTSIDFLAQESTRWENTDKSSSIDRFVKYDDRSIAWSRDLKQDIVRKRVPAFNESKIRRSLYRPFSRQWPYFDPILNEEIYQFSTIFPTIPTEDENRVIGVVNEAQIPFSVQAAASIPCLHYGGRQTQCFPFYIYNEDGTNRRENITDWALSEFRNHYSDPSIAKWDIFHYTYALLHHPEYRTRYAANLKRELPRIPYAPDFHRYAALGKELMDIHIHYEQQPEYPLQRIETGKLDWRVEKMKLAKDKTELRYNSFLTLRGIPPEVADYRLGNRSALEWIVDQYQVSTDKRSGIVNDPNRDDDPQYILRLIGQVIHVSLETVKRTRELSTLALLPAEISV